METIPMRIECFDISNLMGDHTVASMVVFEGGAPKKSDYRRFGIRGAVQDDFAAMAEVLSRRMAQFVAQRERSPHDPEFDESFASVPALIVIDGGKGQLSAGLSELGPFRDLGVTVVSLAKRVEEIFLPGRMAPLVLPHDTAGAAAAAARPRRGAPLRDRVPPRPPRQGDDALDPGRAARRGPGAQAQHPAPLRIAGAVPRGQPRGARGGARAARQGRARGPRVRAQGAMTPGNDKGRLEDFVVITGFSGAGKSQAMATFEDAGYFCVDNLPPEMIGSLADLFGHEGSKVEHAAVASDVRGGEYFDGLVRVVDDLEARGVPYRLLFLEAGDETLINRFKETRRRHPLADGGSVETRHPRRAHDARPAEGARRRVDRHQRPVRVAAAQGGGRQDAHARRGRPAGRDLHDLRLQARQPARRRPHLRRPLPAQPALRVGAARPHRARRRGDRLRRALERHRGVLRAARAAARLPASRLRAGGQVPPDGLHRLHRRAAPVGRDRGAPGRHLRGARRPPRGRGPPRRGQAAAPAPEPRVRRYRSSSSSAEPGVFGRFGPLRRLGTPPEKGAAHAPSGRHQRLRPHRPQRIQRCARARRRHRLGRRQRHHRQRDAGAPPQVRLDPRPVPGRRRGDRRRPRGRRQGAARLRAARPRRPPVERRGRRRGHRVHRPLHEARGRRQAPGRRRQEGDHLGARHGARRDAGAGRERRRVRPRRATT